MTRPFYWSLRREIWEHRSLYVAPIAVAALLLVPLVFHATQVLARVRNFDALSPGKQLAIVVGPYSMAAALILFTCWAVGVFYCVDALNGERRDRSILFWKSMPVSDATTVLAKATVPLVVLPILGSVLALLVQVLGLVATTAVLSAKGIDPSTMVSVMPFFQMPVGMVYGVLAHVLWFAPVYAYLLLVSAWARRAVFLWAVLPFFAAGVVEAVAFGTGRVASFVSYRLTGGMVHAFAADAMKQSITQLSQLAPLKFLATPDVWLGLAFAAACLVLAVRVRRHREPN